MTAQFGYLLNAMERAACESNPAEHDYKGKRIAVLGYVSALEVECERLRAELAQCQQEMQQIRQMGDTIPLPVCEAYGELWMTVTKNKRINRARHLLLLCMTKEERKTGIELVRERMRTSAALNGEEAK